MKTKITYTYCGSVERGNGKPGYSWHNGYSETINGRAAQPWMTAAECRKQAKSQGAVAVFATVNA